MSTPNKKQLWNELTSVFRIQKMVLVTICFLIVVGPVKLFAQDSDVALDPSWSESPPQVSTLVNFAKQESEMRVAVTRYLEDKAALERRYPVRYSPVRHSRLQEFYQGWQQAISEVDFDDLSYEAQIDFILLQNRLAFELEMLDLNERQWDEISGLVPFADSLRLLQENRFDRERIDPRSTAGTLDNIANQLESLTTELIKEAEAEGGVANREGITPAIANRAANYVSHLREIVADWNQFYDGYDPFYNFWVRGPYQQVDEELKNYEEALIRHLVGITPGDPGPIIGDPVMAEGLEAYLDVEMIPYNAEELIAIGWREFERIEEEFRRVSNDMGFGDDWQAALEHVKTLAPPPGEKPWVIFDIAQYSEEYIEDMDNITVPDIAREVWRLDMQTPERQLRNPFFSGGEVTRVSYPTDGMAHQNKLMSMRGNTPSFNFATVHHELIPGHHFQGFMSDRFNKHREDLNNTPFWSEGGALYWELILYEDGFPRDNADKIGMLFWRLHRAARIVFSLNFQLGNWSSQKAVDFLVERVGHERANAEAEVRRTAMVEPLYQIAYLVGGLQLKSLREEVVESGDMTPKEFHDTIWQGGEMPIELVRARLTKHPLTPDYETQWRWTGDPLEGN
jgi:hypothetical protein